MTELANTPEIWKPVYGFKDYAISSFGRFKRVTPGKRGQNPGIIHGYVGNHGYVTVGLSRDGKVIKTLVHRLVCEAFHGPAPTPAHEVAHNDGTRLNNAASNLRWATRKENMADCVDHGTKATGYSHGRTTKPDKTPRGSSHGHAKLTADDVRIIRAADTAVGSGRKLAAWFGVSTATISLIRNRKIWTHI